MKKRKLGDSGLEVSPLAFGGNVFGWTADETMSFRLLDALVAEGFNLYDRADYEKDLEPLCREKGLGVISFFSLASGFLTGKYRSKADLADRARGDIVKKYLNERGYRILAALDRVAQQHNLTPAQAALAWLVAQPTITAPIASASNLEQLNQLIQATTLELDPSSMALLNQASD